MAAVKIGLPISTICLSLYVTTYQTEQSQTAAANFIALRGEGRMTTTGKSPTSCESRTDKQ